jgi:hypothetical protein
MDGKRGTTAVETVERAETANQERLAADLRHLTDLLERERIEEARRYVKELQQRWPDAERVQHYAHVLAPPVSRRRPDILAKPLDREWKWLDEHGHEHPGCWLAIYEDRLIAADPDRRAVLAKTREILGHEGVLLFHQPGSVDSQ